EEDALDDLARIRKEARDPEVRQAAEELLKKAGRDILSNEPGGAKGDNKTPEKIARALPKGKGQPAGGKPGDQGTVKGDGPPGAHPVGKGRGGGERVAGRGGFKGGGGARGGPGGGVAGPAADGTAPPGDEEAARRAGELQLEKLRDKLKDPRVR